MLNWQTHSKCTKFKSIHTLQFLATPFETSSIVVSVFVEDLFVSCLHFRLASNQIHRQPHVFFLCLIIRGAWGITGLASCDEWIAKNIVVNILTHKQFGFQFHAHSKYTNCNSNFECSKLICITFRFGVARDTSRRDVEKPLNKQVFSKFFKA
jgi:uncharacterized membrane protein YtjA (UPF0391 family)